MTAWGVSNIMCLSKSRLFNWICHSNLDFPPTFGFFFVCSISFAEICFCVYITNPTYPIYPLYPRHSIYPIYPIYCLTIVCHCVLFRAVSFYFIPFRTISAEFGTTEGSPRNTCNHVGENGIDVRFV